MYLSFSLPLAFCLPFLVAVGFFVLPAVLLLPFFPFFSECTTKQAHLQNPKCITTVHTTGSFGFFDTWFSGCHRNKYV